MGENAFHPETGELLQRITFLSRSHEIGSDGVIEWRAPGEGITVEEIMRFSRRRVQNIHEWPLDTKATR